MLNYRVQGKKKKKKKKRARYKNRSLIEGENGDGRKGSSVDKRINHVLKEALATDIEIV